MSNDPLLCVIALLHQYQIQLYTEGCMNVCIPTQHIMLPGNKQKTCLHGNYGEPMKFKCISLKYDIFRNSTKCD